MYEVNWNYAVNGLERADILILIDTLRNLENYNEKFVSDEVKRCAKNTADTLQYYWDNPIITDSFKARKSAYIMAQSLINQLVWLSGAVEIICKQKSDISYAERLKNPNFEYKSDLVWYDIEQKVGSFSWGGSINPYNQKWYSLFAKEFSTKPVGWVRFFLD